MRPLIARLSAMLAVTLLLTGFGLSYAQNPTDEDGLKQMGAFKSRPNAEKLAAKLTESGNITTIKEKSISAETYFVVYVQTAKPSSQKQPSAQPSAKAAHKQVASFVKLDNATTTAKELQGSGKDTFICKKKVKKETYYRVYEKAPGSGAQPCAEVDAEPLEMASAAPVTPPTSNAKPAGMQPAAKPKVQKIEKLNTSLRFFINKDAVVYKDNNQDAQQAGIYSDFGGALVLGTVESWYVVRFHDRTIGYINPSDTTTY